MESTEMEEFMQEGECSYNKGVGIFDDDEVELGKDEGECSYDNNKGKATDVDDAVEHGKEVVLDVDSMVDFIEKKLASKRGEPSYRPTTIFKIPSEIFNDAAHSPKVVSIGLLQQGRWGTKRVLDEHKWHYLNKVLSRSKNKLKKYTKEMANIVVEAAFCYSGCLSYESEYELKSRLKDYVNIMVVDGCFLINLFLQLEDGSVEINDPIYSERWMLPWVGHDMLLLENQLPFFVLEKLWELTGRERPTLKTNVLRFFQNLLPEEHDLKPPETEDVHHLLHLIHLSLQPASSSKKPESTSGATIPSPPQPCDTVSTSKSSPFQSTESLQPTSPSRIRIPCSVQTAETREPFGSTWLGHDPHYGASYNNYGIGGSYGNPPPHDVFQIGSGISHGGFLIGPGLFPSGLEQIPRAQQIKQMSERRPAPPPKTIPSATELQEAGVKLQRRRARSFLDVTFEQGLMQIPRLTISDTTNSLFRNFIAFEQGFPDCGNHFTSYCIFMDSLINTPRDVEMLKQAGIIEHVLGSDEEVAFLFNKLCKGITWDFKNSYLAKVFEDVIQHSQKTWPRWRAKLVHDYFSNPWAILSLVAAIVILILTFLQTYFGVFAYFRPP